MAHQRLLKLGIRLMLPLLTLGGFGAIWGLLRVGSSDPTVATSVWSPDTRYRASIVQVYGSSGCATGNSSVVIVERRYFVFNGGQFVPFCLEGPPSSIVLHWQDAQTLAIECNRCGQNYAFADQNWGKLHLVYDFDRP